MKSVRSAIFYLFIATFIFSGTIASAQNNYTEQLTTLHQTATLQFEKEDYEAALNTAAEALHIAEKNLDQADPLYISTVFLVGSFLYNIGEVEQAQPFYEKASLLAQQHMGDKSSDALMIHHELADLYSSSAQFSSAISLLEQSIPAMEQVLGVDDEQTLTSRILLAQSLESAGSLKKAETSLTQTIDRLNAKFESSHPTVIAAEETMASIYKAVGKLKDAENLYQQVLSKQKRQLGASSAEVLITQGNLAEVYRQSGKYNTAEQLFNDTIKEMKSSFNPQDPELFYTLGNLAALYEQMSQFKKAETLFIEIWEFDKKTLGPEHPNTIIDLNNLAGIYRKQGKFAIAEQHFKTALDAIISVLGKEHPESISIANNLALLYENQGIYDKAEPLLKNALKRARKTLGPKNPKTIAMMNNLALLYESQGVFKQSEPLYNKAILLNRSVFGSEHENTIASINNLAYLYLVQEKYKKAGERFESVYRSWKKTFGDKNQKTLKALNNLARVYHKQNRLEEAEKAFKKALSFRTELFKKGHPDIIRSLIDLSALYVTQKKFDLAEKSLTNTLQTAEEYLGDKHPYTFEALNHLADFYELQDLKEQAIKIRKIGFNRRTQFFERVLWASGENTRQAYISLHKNEQDKYLNLLAHQKDDQAAKSALYISLERKGLILKIASEIHKIVQMADSPELAAKAANLDRKRKELSAKTLSGPMGGTVEAFQQELVKLENEVNDLQAELSRASLAYQTTSQKVILEEVFEKIESNDILVDYITYKEQGIAKVLAVTAKREPQSCYLFLSCDEIKLNMVPIGDLATITASVSEFRSTIQDEDAEEEDLLAIAQETYDLIWKPITAHIGKRNSVYLVPDSILHLLPFDALMNENENFLIESLDIKILSSVRDIVIPPLPAAKGDFMIFAGPDYDLENMKSKIKTISDKRSGIDRSMKISSHGLRSLSFEPLDGAEKEGETIQEVSEKKKRSSTIFTQRSAEENQLRNIELPPQMLHIATHGFFLQAEERLKRRLLSVQRGGTHTTPPPGDNPLLRAGLAFAGINSNAPFLGDIDTDNDGVLTAMEVLGLRLSGTRLVVLSACETGVGEIHAGEGVYGLRRSFQEAGVTNVVNSLWPVSDEGTRMLMENFYKNIYEGMAPRKALRKSQRQMMDSEWNHPYYWSAFVMVTRKQP